MSILEANKRGIQTSGKNTGRRILLNARGPQPYALVNQSTYDGSGDSTEMQRYRKKLQ